MEITLLGYVVGYWTLSIWAYLGIFFGRYWTLPSYKIILI